MQKKDAETDLIVDEDPINLEVVEEYLNIADYNTLRSYDGHQTLQLTVKSDAAIDLLITDVTRPYMNGIDLAERFACLYSEVKIVFMSGFLFQSEELPFIPKKELVFIQKPFQPHILLSVLEKPLNKPVGKNQEIIAVPPKGKNSFSQEKLIARAIKVSYRKRQSEEF